MALRINIRHLKTFAWLAVVLAVGGAGTTFWDIYQARNDGSFEERPSGEFQKIRDSRLDEARDLSSTSTSYSEPFQTTMWEARLDGSRYEPPVELTPRDRAEQEQEQKFVVPPLDSIVKISMVAWNSTPALSFVALRYTDAAEPSSVNVRQRRLHLGEGDPLRAPYDDERHGGRVLKIERQKVVFSWGGEEVALTPQLGTDGEGRTLEDFHVADRFDPLAELDGVPEESVQLSDGGWVVGTKDRDEFRQRGPEILEDLGVRTITPDDGRSLLELADVPEDHIIRSYGFQSGDRIISVNGIPMASKSAAWNWYQNNDGLPTYVVKYESRGQTKTTTIHNTGN